MNRLILTIVILCTSISAFSQSKADTQSWIANAINKHKHFGSDCAGVSKILFNDSKMILEFRKSCNDDKGHSFELPIKEIKYFSIEDEYPLYKLLFSCNPEEKCFRLTGLEFDDIKVDSIMQMNSVVILVDFSSFYDDNMPVRFKKAIAHLVSIYGGKLKDDTF